MASTNLQNGSHFVSMCQVTLTKFAASLHSMQTPSSVRGKGLSSADERDQKRVSSMNLWGPFY